MKRLRWQILIVVLALIAIAILLLGQQPVLQTNVPEPTSGGLYIEGLVGSVGRLNPVLDFYNPVDRDVDRLIYSSLFRFDDRGNAIPDLVENWGLSLDGTVYNVVLKTGAVWHDGTPLTTEDVLFTIDLLRHPEIPTPLGLGDMWETIEVVTFDEHNMQFRLPEPFAPFLDYLTFGVLPKHLLGELTPTELIDDQFNLNPVGSGPYRFEQLLVEEGVIAGVVLNAFDDFYNASSEKEARESFIEIADAICDLIYVLSGTAVSLGIPLEECWAEVQRSNMSKIPEDGVIRRRDDGKILKPKTFSPADLKGVIFNSTKPR